MTSKPKIIQLEPLGPPRLDRIRTNEVALLNRVKTNEIPTSSEAVLMGVCEEKVGGGSLESRMSEGEGELEWEYDQGGLRAYGVVFACFMLSGIHMGYGLLQGTLLQELHQEVYPDVPLSTLNFLSGLTNFSTTSFSFFAGRLGDKFGYKRMIAVGSIATFISLVISAFTYDKLPLIFLFQGAVLGAAQGISMPVFLSLPSQYFLRRRGLMTGLAASGSGFMGGLAGLIVKALLPKVGYRNTLLIYAGINVVVWSVSYSLIHVRLPPLKPGESRVPKDWLPKGVWTDVAFYSLTLCVAIGIFGYLTPFYYISIYTTLKTSYASESIYTTFPLVISNFSGGIGRIAAGYLADKIGPINALFLAFFLGGALQACFWPFAQDYASIMVFAALYGLFGSPTISLLPVAASSLYGVNGLATLVGFIILMNSWGQLVGSSISGVILTASGGNYVYVSLYSGGMMIIGGLILLPARFSREKRWFAVA